jgi:hypothetical protein
MSGARGAAARESVPTNKTQWLAPKLRGPTFDGPLRALTRVARPGLAQTCTDFWWTNAVKSGGFLTNARYTSA